MPKLRQIKVHNNDETKVAVCIVENEEYYILTQSTCKATRFEYIVHMHVYETYIFYIPMYYDENLVSISRSLNAAPLPYSILK